MIRISVFFVAGSILGLCTSGALSAPKDTYDKCVGSTSTNSEWAECGRREISRQESRLNAAWKKAQSCFDIKEEVEKNAKEALLDEQRLWVKWKNGACTLFYYGGREGQVLNYPMCKIKVIKDRVDWLTDFTNDCHR